jgi:cytochrome c-type biogenesis protein
MENITYLTALGAGLASFVLPCVLPLVPIYIAILAGPEILDTKAEKKKAHVFLHSLVFVAGFTTVFVGLGAGAGLVGLAININFFVVKRVAGILLIVFGALFLLSQKIPRLSFQRHLTPSQSSGTGYVRSFVTGAIFSMASMSCATYILGSILMLAVASETAVRGASLLAVYSLGLGIPFLIIGAAFDTIAPMLKRIQRHSRAIYIATGIILVVLGTLVLTNQLTLLISPI